MKQSVSFAGFGKSARFVLAFALLLAVGTFGFYACSNKKVTSEEVKPEKVVRNNKTVLVNPYDYVGVFHNDALRHFSTQSNFQTLTQTQAIDLTASLYTSQNLPNANVLTSQFVQSFYTVNATHNLKVLADSLYAISAISYEVKDAWTTLNNHFTDPALRNFSDYKAAFTHLRSNIAQTEQTFLQNTYNDLDKALILIVTATAKHSAKFWEEVLDDTNNPYYETQGKVKWWEWILIGLTDVAGAAVGAVKDYAEGGGPAGGIFSIISGIGGAITVGGTASYLTWLWAKNN